MLKTTEMTIEPVRSYRFLYAVQLNKAEAGCENCGHAIAQCFYIEHVETKKVIVVGCECVGHLLSTDHIQSFERNKTRLTRAAAQWRKQLPAAFPNETRTEYINRRLKEMDNASVAHKAWVAICKSEHTGRFVELPDAPLTLRGIELQLLKECGVSPFRFQHFGDFRWETWVHEQRSAIMTWWREETARRLKTNQEEFAKRYNANPFDFTKTSWDVRKV